LAAQVEGVKLRKKKKYKVYTGTRAKNEKQDLNFIGKKWKKAD